MYTCTWIYVYCNSSIVLFSALPGNWGTWAKMTVSGSAAMVSSTFCKHYGILSKKMCGESLDCPDYSQIIEEVLTPSWKSMSHKTSTVLMRPVYSPNHYLTVPCPLIVKKSMVPSCISPKIT